MPLPRTTDVGKIIKFLRKEKPGMPFKQMLEIALERVRKLKSKKRSKGKKKKK